MTSAFIRLSTVWIEPLGEFQCLSIIQQSAEGWVCQIFMLKYWVLRAKSGAIGIKDITYNSTVYGPLKIFLMSNIGE